MQVDGTMLIDLLKRSMEIGTERAAIDLAVEWIEAAEKEIGRLREQILDMSADPLGLEPEGD